MNVEPDFDSSSWSDGEDEECHSLALQQGREDQNSLFQ